MDKCKQKHAKTQNCCCSEEIRSNECEFIHMTEQEEDIICRMHKLVGNQVATDSGKNSRKNSRRNSEILEDEKK
ncbi:hypothetical protein OROGR_031878 [Orobanche gracilis]